MGILIRPSLLSVTKIIGAAVSVALVASLTACASGPMPGPTAIPLRPTEEASFEVADVEALMEQMQEAGAPAVFVEIRDGEQVWSGVEGVRSKKTELPALITDPARIASLTKPMVATILLQLVEEGLVQLGDSIEDHLPGVVDGRLVTVRQLLNHSSGLPDYVPVLALEDPSQITAQIVSPISHEELVARAQTQEWSFEPGTGFEYSNTNYIVLTMLIEHLTDNTLPEELRARITEPLGLSNTSLPTGTEMPERAAHGYVVEGAVSIDVTEQDASLWSGAGGIVSTVSDVNTFMRALLTGELIAPELLGEMLVLLPEGYGLGVQSRTDTCPSTEPVYLKSSTNQADDSGAPDASDTPRQSTMGESTSSTDPASEAQAAEETLPTDQTLPTEESVLADELLPADEQLPADETLATENPLLGYDFEPAEEGSGSLHESEFGELVQIGAPRHVYGHLGSGLGYRGLTMSSPDGVRQVTILWTVSPTDYGEDPRLLLAYDLADVALSLHCE